MKWSERALLDLPCRRQQHSHSHFGIHPRSWVYAFVEPSAELHLCLHLLLRSNNGHLWRVEAGGLETMGPVHDIQAERSGAVAARAAERAAYLLLAFGGSVSAGGGGGMCDAGDPRGVAREPA